MSGPQDSGMDSARLAAMLHNQNAPGGGQNKMFLKDVNMGQAFSPTVAAPKMNQPITAGVNKIWEGKGQPRFFGKIAGELQIQSKAKLEGFDALKKSSGKESPMGAGAGGKGEASKAVYGEEAKGLDGKAANPFDGLGLRRPAWAEPLYGQRMKMLNRLIPPMLFNLMELRPEDIKRLYGAAEELRGAGVRPMAPVSTSALGNLQAPQTPGMGAKKRGMGINM